MKRTSRKPTTLFRSVTDTMSQGKPQAQPEKDAQIQRVTGDPGVRSGGEARCQSQPGKLVIDEVIDEELQVPCGKV